MTELNPKNRRVLFVDMNSFFASCEQAENPALVGKPIIIVPTAHSCALAASYEAKAFGIKTGTSEKEARFLCPKVIAIQARPRVYMDYHYRLVRILESVSPGVVPRSVDEASLPLFSNEDPLKLAQIIKEKIWAEFGKAMNCSIGIGPNIFLAKLATDMRKPNGLLEITLENLEEIYGQINLTTFCGISYAMERRLHNLGIMSPLDFYHTPPAKLRQALGIIGERWWLKMRGYPLDEFSTGRKSLSHSHVLPPIHRSPKESFYTLQRLASKVGRRLRKNGYATSRIGLYIRFLDKTRFVGGLRIRPTADTISLNEHLAKLWQEAGVNRPVMHLGIWTNQLVPLAGLPAPLFPIDRKRQSLANALDTINDRYGIDQIRFASLDGKTDRAPDRISFTALFDIEHGNEAR